MVRAYTQEEALRPSFETSRAVLVRVCVLRARAGGSAR